MAAAEDTTWVHSGSVTKRGENRKTWKKRFMVLYASGVLR